MIIILIGNSLNRLNKFEEAIKMFDKALQIDPYLEEAYINKGMGLNISRKFLWWSWLVKLGNPNEWKGITNKSKKY